MDFIAQKRDCDRVSVFAAVYHYVGGMERASADSVSEYESV